MISSDITPLVFNDLSCVIPKPPIPLLNKDSPRFAQTEKQGVLLKPHQQALVYRCKQLEDHAINISHRDTIQVSIKTSFGVISDDVGSGKSYCVLELICSGSEVLNTKPPSKMNVIDDGQWVSTETYIPTRHPSRANLLLVPTHLSRQWRHYIHTYMDDAKYEIAFVTNKIEYEYFLVQAANFTNVWDKFDIVLMTFTYYKDFTESWLMSHSNHRDIYIKRLFVDEADTLCKSGDIQAAFTWFITANIDNMMYPMFQATRKVGIRNLSMVRRRMSKLFEEKYKQALFVRNDPRFVKESFALPAIIQHIVECKSPAFLNAMIGIADRRFVESLNANDYAGAMMHLGINIESQTGSEDHILHLFINNLETRKKELEVDLEAATISHALTGKHEVNVRMCKSRCDEVEDKITCIRDRIQKETMCKICFDEIEMKTILKCCQNTFCFKCVNQWLIAKHVCPMCKQHISFEKDVFVAHEMGASLSNHAPTMLTDKNLSKIDNMTRIIDHLDMTRARILIFTSHANSDYDALTRKLDQKSIKYKTIKGNVHCINKTIHDFKEGDVRVIFANSDRYASGLNLENTTDVILMHKLTHDIHTQIIGRAQRMGRTEPLHVWELLYPHEQATLPVSEARTSAGPSTLVA